ncbi:16S rRNA (cytidine(1402)-2'-O)-methyltransferase [Candidatus Gracilibacteria bacterium]|nr:16S rRNA (cytidine(1402)-2'-O)-methyltransferase [Candidatus Gracilibacteria bacterium]
MLYIVSTPIGNLEDITFRAIKTLNEVDLIACEDTRTSSVLLNYYNIKKPLISYHSYSKITKVDKIIEELKAGKKVALISDAGTPGISDPGYALIKEALNNDINVVPIPGVSACITALSVSGMPSNHFLYLGFLPIKKGRQTLFKKLQNKEQTVIIYESVHRIIKTLNEFITYFGKDLEIVVGRELTKKFEEFKRGKVGDILEYFENNKDKVKGEFVIIF